MKSTLCGIALNIVEKIYHLLYDSNSSFVYMYGKKDDPAEGFDFSTGRALFYMYKLSHMATYRETDVDFGILPFPKYDEAQENYYSLSWGSMICSPITADPEMAGAVAEQLNYESRKTVYPAYYDITLNGKLTRDDQSAKMLDIIFDGTVYEFGLNYSDYGNALYIVSTMLKKRSTDVASFYEQKISAEQQHYLDLYDSIKNANS